MLSKIRGCQGLHSLRPGGVCKGNDPRTCLFDQERMSTAYIRNLIGGLHLTLKHVLHWLSLNRLSTPRHFFEVVVFVLSHIQTARLRGIKALTAFDWDRLHSLNDLIAISFTLGQNIVLTSIDSNVSLVRLIYRRRKRQLRYKLQHASYNMDARAISSFIALASFAPSGKN